MNNNFTNNNRYILPKTTTPSFINRGTITRPIQIPVRHIFSGLSEPEFIITDFSRPLSSSSVAYRPDIYGHNLNRPTSADSRNLPPLVHRLQANHIIIANTIKIPNDKPKFESPFYSQTQNYRSNNISPNLSSLRSILNMTQNPQLPNLIPISNNLHFKPNHLSLPSITEEPLNLVKPFKRNDEPIIPLSTLHQINDKNNLIIDYSVKSKTCASQSDFNHKTINIVDSQNTNAFRETVSNKRLGVNTSLSNNLHQTSIMTSNVNNSVDETRNVKNNCISESIKNCSKKTLKTDLLSSSSSDYSIDNNEEYETVDFVWDDYLQRSSAIAAPSNYFNHVELSLKTEFKKGMKLEVLNPMENGDDSYWPASILMVCGQLLRLRPEASPRDGSLDYWCDMAHAQVKNEGWALQNGKNIAPPLHLKSSLVNWERIIETYKANISTNSSFKTIKNTTGTLVIDNITEGMILEVQSKDNPLQSFLAMIIKNIGGRLLLEPFYLDIQKTNNETDKPIYKVENVPCSSICSSFQPVEALSKQCTLKNTVNSDTEELKEKYKDKVSEEYNSYSCMQSYMQPNISLLKANSLNNQVSYNEEESIVESTIIFKQEINVSNDLQPVGLMLNACSLSNKVSDDREEIKVNFVKEECRNTLDNGQSANGSLQDNQFWKFYLDSCLHPVGWSEDNDCKLIAFSDMLSQKDILNWELLIEKYSHILQDKAVPIDIFDDQDDIPEHAFEEGMFLEFLNSYSGKFHAAVIDQVFNAKYFSLKTIDEINESHDFDNSKNHCENHDLFTVKNAAVLSRQKVFIGSNLSAKIFPVGWCKQNSIELEPKNDTKLSFDWDTYFQKKLRQIAPSELFHQLNNNKNMFKAGMKLEVAKRSNKNQICVATIIDVKSTLLFISFDHEPLQLQIESYKSHGIFPIGWCDCNDWLLITPIVKSKVRRTDLIKKCDDKQDKLNCNSNLKNGTAVSSQLGAWCPRIFFNSRCFSGPFLNKGRLQFLPQSVGPGSLLSVLTSVLTKLVSCAYKPNRVMKELRMKGASNVLMQQTVIKAKYKARNYQATVEICSMTNQVFSFLRDTCALLQCCSNLISTQQLIHCPENCSKLSKGKHKYNMNKTTNRRLSSKTSFHSNIDQLQLRASLKRHKHKRLLLTLRKKTESDYECSDGFYNIASDCGTLVDNTNETDSQKLKSLNNTTYETRGVTMPKMYRFERKTHKKVFHEEVFINNSVNTKEPSSKQSENSLTSNPAHWTPLQVADFLKTTDSSKLARIIIEQEIDGLSFILLNLPTVQEFIEPKLGPALKLCRQVERIKLIFFKQFSQDPVDS